MRGTFGNGGTSAYQPSESSDLSSTQNFKKRSVSADARAFTPNYLPGVDLFTVYSERTVVG